MNPFYLFDFDDFINFFGGIVLGTLFSLLVIILFFPDINLTQSTGDEICLRISGEGFRASEEGGRLICSTIKKIENVEIRKENVEIRNG